MDELNRACPPVKEALFRAQVVEQRSAGLHGDVLLVPRRRDFALIVFLSIWLLAVGAWLAIGTYARKQTVMGWLEPPTGVVRLYPEASGQVMKIMVKEGDKVRAGQPLIIIKGDRTLVEGGNVESRLLDEFESQRRLLDEQITRAGETQQEREDSLKRQIKSIEHKLRLLDTQLSTLNSRHALIESQLARIRPVVEQGHISRIDFDNLQAQELALRSDQQDLLLEIGNQRELLSLRRTDLQLLPQDAANNLDQLQSRMSELAQQTARLQSQRAHVITATRDGVVGNLQVREGQFVSVTNPVPVMTLDDGAGVLTAHLLVPVRAIGFVEPGQRLDIRYDAFPYQKFGLYAGKVERVSKTPLLPGELLNAPVNFQEPVYRVEAVLIDQGVRAYGQDIPLKAGMTLSADVEVGERRLWQWLLEPIYSLRGRL